MRAPGRWVGSADGACDAPHLQYVVGGGEQFPFAVDGVEATPVEASRASDLFDLSEDRFDGDGSFGVDGSTPFGFQFAFHPLQGRGRRTDASGSWKWRVRSNPLGLGGDEQFG